jgi:hypothetical protein
MSSAHWDKLKACFPKPPSQGPVGESPALYLAKLNQLCGTKLAWPSGYPTGLLNRTQLTALCQDPAVDVLVGYAAVMAWGRRGVTSPNYRKSLEPEPRKYLIAILHDLRNSTRSRIDDYAAMWRAAETINGLGISYYTKLLFFFRPRQDCYILDQFTAKSSRILSDPPVVRLTSAYYPEPDTSQQEYENFCLWLDREARNLSTLGTKWTAEQVEQALFDQRGGEWRRYVRIHFPKTSRKAQREQVEGSQDSRGVSEQPSESPSKLPLNIAKAIATLHRQELDAGNTNLPELGGAPTASKPCRLHCDTVGGVQWLYAIQETRGHAQVFCPTERVHTYDRLRRDLGVVEHDFGDGIVGNGDKGGDTRSIKLTSHFELTDQPKPAEIEAVARQAVADMETLYRRVGEHI